MGREVRMVKKGWVHPKNEHGRYIPLYEGTYSLDKSEWDMNNQKWNEGLRDDYNGGWQKLSGDELNMSYEDWAGEEPNIDNYMPEWKKEEKTLYMMYENTSEGTPKSPAFETPEELAKWLFENKVSSFGTQTSSYESWLRVCKGGYAPSLVFSQGVLNSGVDAFSNDT